MFPTQPFLVVSLSARTLSVLSVLHALCYLPSPTSSFPRTLRLHFATRTSGFCMCGRITLDPHDFSFLRRRSLKDYLERVQPGQASAYMCNNMIWHSNITRLSSPLAPHTASSERAVLLQETSLLIREEASVIDANRSIDSFRRLLCCEQMSTNFRSLCALRERLNESV